LRQNNKEFYKELDHKITTVMGEMQQFDAQRANLNYDMERIQNEIISIEQRNEKRKEHIETISEGIPSLTGECERIFSQIQSLKEEMGTQLLSQLNDAERAAKLPQ